MGIFVWIGFPGNDFVYKRYNLSEICYYPGNKCEKNKII